jgi:hypothetical protein
VEGWKRKAGIILQVPEDRLRKRLTGSDQSLVYICWQLARAIFEPSAAYIVPKSLLFQCFPISKNRQLPIRTPSPKPQSQKEAGPALYT